MRSLGSTKIVKQLSQIVAMQSRIDGWEASEAFISARIDANLFPVLTGKQSGDEFVCQGWFCHTGKCCGQSTPRSPYPITQILLNNIQRHIKLAGGCAPKAGVFNVYNAPFMVSSSASIDRDLYSAGRHRMRTPSNVCEVSYSVLARLFTFHVPSKYSPKHPGLICE
jgi:hypothetical protein